MVVSVVTAWELVIKVGTGKLVLHRPLKQLWSESLETNGFTALDVASEHVLAVEELPLHNRDPFDRLLIAQAIREDLDLVSADAAFTPYPVRRVW